MPTPHFQSSPNKEPAKADLRGGMPVEDVAKKYNISERTVFHYKKQIEDEKSGISNNKPGGIVTKQGGPIAVSTQPSPAAVDFSYTPVREFPDTLTMLDMYSVYRNLKELYPFKDSFSEFMKRCVFEVKEMLMNNLDYEQVVPEIKKTEEITEGNNGTKDGTEPE